jgi:hypothetical protein
MAMATKISECPDDPMSFTGHLLGWIMPQAADEGPSKKQLVLEGRGRTELFAAREVEG